MTSIRLLALSAFLLSCAQSLAILQIPEFRNGRATVGLYGVLKTNSANPDELIQIDKSGNIVPSTAKERDAAFWKEPGPVTRFSEKKNGETKFGLKNRKTGKILIPATWAALNQEGDDQNKKHCVVQDTDGNWGVVDFKGKVVVDPQWDRVSIWTGGPWVIKKGEKYGLAKAEKILVQPRWEATGGSFSTNGKMAVKKNGKWGYVNRLGTMVIPPKYEEAIKFVKNRAIVKDAGSYFLIDLAGKKVCKLPGQPGTYREGSFIHVKKGEKWGCADLTGKLVTPFKWDAVGAATGRGLFSEGLAPVLLGEKWGYINQQGKLVIPCKWDLVGDFSEGLAYIEGQGKWGFIDKTGKVVIKAREMKKRFSEGLASVKRKDKWGFVNQQGRLVVPCKYDSVRKFSEGLAAVKLGNKWGYVNQQAKLVIPCKYEIAGNFSNGHAIVVEKPGKTLFIDKTGKTIKR